MRLRLDTLFGRLFGVLFVAIVLAHLLAFTWFKLYGPPRRRPLRRFPKGSTGKHPHTTPATRHVRVPGSVARSYR